MKTRVKVLGMVMFGAVLGGVGCAGPKEAAHDVEAAVPGLAQKSEGVVTSVNKEGNLVEVKPVDKPGEPPVWFALTPDTKMEREGRLVGINDLSQGTPVRVSYEPATGPEKTLKLEVLTGAKADEVKAKADQQK